MNASIPGITRGHFTSENSYCSMHMVISPGDINSYRVNEQGKYRTQVLHIFLIIKTPCSGRHATVYTVHVAVLTFNVIQGE